MRIDAVAGKVQSQIAIASLTKNLGVVTHQMERAMSTMNPDVISKQMDLFEKQFENLDVVDKSVSEAVGGVVVTTVEVYNPTTTTLACPGTQAVLGACSDNSLGFLQPGRINPIVTAVGGANVAVAGGRAFDDDGAEVAFGGGSVVDVNSFSEFFTKSDCISRSSYFNSWNNLQ